MYIKKKDTVNEMLSYKIFIGDKSVDRWRQIKVRIQFPLDDCTWQHVLREWVRL